MKAQLNKADRLQMEGALIAWEAVLSLIKSGTPIDGLRAIAEQNVKFFNQDLATDEDGF